MFDTTKILACLIFPLNTLPLFAEFYIVIFGFGSETSHMTRTFRRSVGQSVCLNFLKGREVSPPCFYRSTCL